METLNDRDKKIKEYNIAVNVLKHFSSFNCNDNAIVWIHARRLRWALSSYYITEGQSNQIYIDVPKGCYIPQFKQREKATESCYSYKSLSAIQTNATVAIFPFKCLSEGKEKINNYNRFACSCRRRIEIINN